MSAAGSPQGARPTGDTRRAAQLRGEDSSEALERLRALEREHPEWSAWLGVLQVALEAVASRQWDAWVPAASGGPGRPLLDGAALFVDAQAVAGVWGELVRASSRCAPALGVYRSPPQSRESALATFAAALRADAQELDRIAKTLRAPPQPLRALAALAAIPFLHACRRRWSAALPRAWTHGYCPVCAAWPAFVETSGVDRQRRLRCGRCGSGWSSQCLYCPYCGTSDHERMGTWIPGEGRHDVIEFCTACRGYLKAFTRLAPCAAAQVLVEDLASAELDLVAAARGYRRPSELALPLSLTVAHRGGAA